MFVLRIVKMLQIVWIRCIRGSKQGRTLRYGAFSSFLSNSWQLSLLLATISFQVSCLVFIHPEESEHCPHSITNLFLMQPCATGPKGKAQGSCVQTFQIIIILITVKWIIQKQFHACLPIHLLSVCAWLMSAWWRCRQKEPEGDLAQWSQKVTYPTGSNKLLFRGPCIALQSHMCRGKWDPYT